MAYLEQLTYIVYILYTCCNNQQYPQFSIKIVLNYNFDKRINEAEY